MRLYLIIPACFLTILSASSCKRNFDCHCTTRGARTEYVETVRAENRADAVGKCSDHEDNVNAVTIPGVDCELAEDSE